MNKLLQMGAALWLGVVCCLAAEPGVPDFDPISLDAVISDAPATAPAATNATNEDAALPVPHDQTRVAILGYHNFSETAPVTEMLMRTSEFREQMEAIRRSGYSVISMQEFLEWRFGARELPAKCILITLDDGWKSVYTDAYPILKEYGYPFHLFLYTTYLTGRGDSMTPAQVKEMMAHGASIGSHSTTHPYPKEWKAHEAQGEEEYGRFIDKEIGESFTKLGKLFGPINTYCYPGGYLTRPMLDRLPGYGYIAAFTVVPGKVTDKEDPFRIHRYMVFGTDPSIFRNAMDFRVAQLGKTVSTGSAPGTLPASTPPPPFSVSPKPNETVGCDVPAITASMSDVAGVELSSVRMAVSGFGRVPAKVDENTRTVQWTPPMRIYMPNLSVHVTWNSTDGTSHKAEWSFAIDASVQQEQQ
ncbi:MAG: polysaccharide deacetylase family protein [Akkermansia sp.]|nr:polysaccharide deacetylase family protein [Akkermansia sp.]